MIKQLSVTPPGLWSNETLVLVTNLEYEAASLPCPLVCDSVTENNPLLYICNKCMARAEPRALCRGSCHELYLFKVGILAGIVTSGRC